jgi:hypothetical protein
VEEQLDSYTSASIHGEVALLNLHPISTESANVAGKIVFNSLCINRVYMDDPFWNE